MQFPYEVYELPGRVAKRRKLYHPHNMAQSTPAGPPIEDANAAQLELEHESRSSPTEHGSAETRTSDREELMACLKRGEKPTWIPRPSVQVFHEQEKLLLSNFDGLNPARSSKATTQPSTVDGAAQKDSVGDNARPEIRGIIQRPRSALHRGDFAENTSDADQTPVADDPFRPGLAISPSPDFGLTPHQWLARSPYDLSSTGSSHLNLLERSSSSCMTRHRAPSVGNSLSSSYVFRAPTSPLVQASTHSYIDLPGNHDSLDRSRTAGRDNRRRTMPPNAFHSLSMTTPEPTTPNFSRPLSASLRREVSLPIHTHQSRRSLSSFTYQPKASPQPLFPRSRRASQSSDSASRRRMSMVGSFEESLLRGTMSTPASKPLDFVAQIGVMGRGECPASLKCPAHVTVSFPAVFYSYPAVTSARSISDDTPSPYVGRIDLEHNIKSVTLATSKTKRSSLQSHDAGHTDNTNDKTAETTIKLGGAYRVPKQGQLQIIIKNPNATAVKLFLVPYDLNGMPAETKTFIRQKSFSSGAVVEEAISQGGTKSTVTDNLEAKNILRYLIHVKFCCPSKNRFYLYDDIRVVFANRVPDGKEKLRNEIQLPEPRFTSWRPQRATPKSQPAKTVLGISSDLALESELAVSLWSSPREFDAHDTPSPSPLQPSRRSLSPYVDSPPPRDDIPRMNPRLATDNPILFHFDDVQHDESHMERSVTPIKGFHAAASPRDSPLPWRSPSNEFETLRSYSSVPPEAPGSGLISQQFQDLDQKKKKERKRMQNILSGESGSSEEASP